MIPRYRHIAKSILAIICGPKCYHGLNKPLSILQHPYFKIEKEVFAIPSLVAS